MVRCSCLAVLLVTLCVPTQILAAHIKLFSLKDLAAEWLADQGAKDASADFDAVVAEILTSDKKLAAVSRFEKAILNGKPLDPDMHALHIALNYLRASDMKYLAVIPDYKTNGTTAFTGDKGTIHGSGGLTSALDFSAAQKLKPLGKVACDVKVIAEADRFELMKGMPGTARLSVRVIVKVSRKGSETEYRREVGQFRITAFEDSELRGLPRWKSKSKD